MPLSTQPRFSVVIRAGGNPELSEKNNASSLKALTDRRQVIGYRRPRAVLKASHSRQSDVGRISKLLLRPSKKATRGARLCSGYRHARYIATSTHLRKVDDFS